jgi:hypothetical protein
VGCGIYRESLPPTLCQTSRRPATLAYVRWFLHSNPKGVSYVRYYLKGFQKVAYIWWSHVRLPVQFAGRTSSGSPSYVRTTDRGVRSADLAYVHLLRVSVWLLFSKGSKCDYVNVKDLGSRLSGFIEGLVKHS